MSRNREGLLRLCCEMREHINGYHSEDDLEEMLGALRILRDQADDLERSVLRHYWELHELSLFEEKT